jgi:hypothetical protein
LRLRTGEERLYGQTRNFFYIFIFTLHFLPSVRRRMRGCLLIGFFWHFNFDHYRPIMRNSNSIVNLLLQSLKSLFHRLPNYKCKPCTTSSLILFHCIVEFTMHNVKFIYLALHVCKQTRVAGCWGGGGEGEIICLCQT